MPGLRTFAKKFVPNVHAVAVTAEVIPATDQTPPSSSRSGPPESPEHTALLLDVASVCNCVPPTALIVVEPARSVAAT